MNSCFTEKSRRLDTVYFQYINIPAPSNDSMGGVLYPKHYPKQLLNWHPFFPIHLAPRGLEGPGIDMCFKQLPHDLLSWVVSCVFWFLLWKMSGVWAKESIYNFSHLEICAVGKLSVNFLSICERSNLRGYSRFFRTLASNISIPISSIYIYESM